MIEVGDFQAQDFKELIMLYQNHDAYGGHYDEERDTLGRLGATADQGNLLVARDVGQLVGSVMILDNPHSFWLLRFVVDPEYKEQLSVAQKLFDRATELARERGHQSVIVYTDSEDERLNQRYVALGCHASDTYRCYWKEAK